MNALAKCKTLEDIDVSQTKISSPGVRELAVLPRLKRLNLYLTFVNNSEFDSFPATIEWLNLDKCPITDEGLAKLASLSKLTWMHLAGKIGDRLRRRFFHKVFRFVPLWVLVPIVNVTVIVAVDVNRRPDISDTTWPPERFSDLAITDLVNKCFHGDSSFVWRSASSISAISFVTKTFPTL